MATPQTSPDAEGGDGRDDQQHEAVVSSFLSGGLSGTHRETNTSSSSCAELPASAGAVDTTAKKAPPTMSSSDTRISNDTSAGGDADVPTIASPLLGATEAADATAIDADMSDEWQLNDWPDGDAGGETHVEEDSRQQLELEPQHMAINSDDNGTMGAAVAAAATHAVSDTGATNLNFGVISGGGSGAGSAAQQPSTASALASASASNDRDVLGAPPSPDDASRSTTPPDREVYHSSSSAAATAAAKRRQFQAQQTEAQTETGAQPSFTAEAFALDTEDDSGAATTDMPSGLHAHAPQQTPLHSASTITASTAHSTTQKPYVYQQLGTVGTFSTSVTGRILTVLSQRCFPNKLRHTHSGSALAGFLSLLLVTCSSYMLSPMRDAAALAVGVDYIPALTLASTVLALASSVPVGWLFEAPNPARRGRFFNRVGLTRGETQGTSLALFYRCFALCLVGYAMGFKIVEIMGGMADDSKTEALSVEGECSAGQEYGAEEGQCVTTESESETMASMMSMLPLGMSTFLALLKRILTRIVKSRFGKLFYVAFFLVVHLMKLHSLSLIWGVTSEAMEYEEQAEKRERQRLEEEEARAAESAWHSEGSRHRNAVSSARRYSAPHYVHHGSHPAHKHRPVLTSIPSGEVAPTNAQHQEAEQERQRQQQREQQQQQQQKPSSRSRIRLKRLAFVGFGGTLGGILGSVIASGLARTLHISGLLVVAAILLELSAELSIELGNIMLRHWQEEQIRIMSCGDLATLGLQSAGNLASSTSLASLAENKEISGDEVDSSMKRVASLGSMKRIASGNSITSMQRARSAASLSSSDNNEPPAPTGMKRSAKSMGSLADAGRKRDTKSKSKQQRGDDSVASSATDRSDVVEDSSFKQRLLRGIKTILTSRLLMCIFTYNALAATTSVLLSFQRAELVANRTVEATSTERDTAFLANVNMASSVAVFALQASGLGAFIASSCGQYGTLVLMPMIRMFGVLMLAWWHVQGAGQAPNLTLFLLLDEFTKVMNFAVAKPVRESLWRGLSAEARYDAKPIVDTLANRWGGGSAAFLTSAIGHIMATTGVGSVAEDGTKTLFGFPPVLILCSIAAVWWAVVSVDLGGIRKRIDAELKKQQ